MVVVLMIPVGLGSGLPVAVSVVVFVVLVVVVAAPVETAVETATGPPASLGVFEIPPMPSMPFKAAVASWTSITDRMFWFRCVVSDWKSV